LPRIILILVSVVLLMLAILYFRRQDSASQKRIVMTVLLSLIAVGLLLLAVTGRLSWLVAVVGSLLAFIPKIFAVLMRFYPAIQPFLKRFLMNKFSSGRGGYASSIYETLYLKVTVNPVTGAMDGMVLKGAYSGRQLSLMLRGEVEALLSECTVDQESYLLLMTYLQRCKPEWEFSQQSYKSHPASTMSKKEAADILGIVESASRQDVIKAHRRLIQKLHPDRGGSDYLAAKINQAKDVLLG